MSRLQKFNEIVRLAKSANGKLMSECSELEQHAVLFLGNKYPASLETGIVKYSKTAPTYTYACSYVEARKINQVVGGDNKFQQNSFHIFPDINPTFPEDSATQALDIYPNILKIPAKPITYETLEPLLPKQEKSIENPKIQISGQICRVYAGLMHKEEMELPELTSHYIIHKYRDQFLTLCETLELTALSTAILNYKPHLEKRARGHTSYEDTNSKMSYLATYLYFASKGIYLKVKEDI